ncbi:MAG: family 43 glycosylhydrolase [Lachnospiraceae bacterium]|jgi:arabinan endo-1,5-alpha-L-arabinosidase|nr:family 43 glycosylhydrolase [Lachnospiraceae bacterium]
MKKRRREWLLTWLGILMLSTLAIAVLGVQSTCAFAAASKISKENALTPYTKTEDGYSEQSGITVTTSLDKPKYKSGETANVTVEVKNTNKYDVSEVKVKYKLPNNIKLTSGRQFETIKTLAANETKQLTLTATVTEDQNAPLVKGAYTPYIVGAICAAVFIIALAAFFIAKKKKGKQTLSMLLVLLLATNSFLYFAPTKAEAEKAENSDAKEKGSEDTSGTSKKPTTETGNYEVPLEQFFFRTSVHDPSVVKDTKTGMYYIFGSHMAFSKSKNLMEWNTFETNIHTDYRTLFKEPWNEWAGPASPGKDLSGMMWAPDVIWNEAMQKWCMYMSINGDNWVSSICLLTADNIEGPYEYKGVVVYSGMNNPKIKVDEKKTDIYKVLGDNADLSRYTSTGFSCINAIDPNVQFDEKGDLYMTYGSWSAGIYQLKLDVKTGLRDYGTTYETKRDESDAYLGVKIAGGYYCSGEAPYILKTGKYYYLFLSYAALEAVGGYQMRIYRSENISGPYVDQNGISAIRTKAEDVKLTNYGLRIFSSYDMHGLSKVEVAQGHNSAFIDDDDRIYLVYHTRFQSESGTMEMHQVRVHQMFINEDDWLVAAPYEYSGETISDIGYAMEDMAGTYEFVYHEPTSFYSVAGGKQLGIVGKGRKSNKLQLQKEITIGKHISTLSAEVSFVQTAPNTITLNEDGTVTGTYRGKWTYDKEKMSIDLGNGFVYKGVFLKQADEDSRAMTMTFTAEGKNVAVWGVKPPENQKQ